ncbi:MAG TPA: TIGR03790 family protein [Opitutaceae bacterium]
MGFPIKLSAALVAFALAAAARGSELAERVVIVANSDAPDSLAIARHYAKVRGVPPGNVIALRMPVAETITWPEFVASIWAPLEDELVRRGWIDAIAMDLFDDVGRRKYAISGHRIAALVLCRGVPLRISHDQALYKEVGQFTAHEEFRTNQGAVDSELSLLAQTNYPINACVPNPLFGNPFPTADELSRVVKVSRLDGPTAADALGLVDLAVEAERTGILGRAYVDLAGTKEVGNRWLSATAAQLAELGFDLSVGRRPQTFQASARIDAPVLYFGWYTPDLNGPFALPGFRFPPGAVAVHIHSFSANTLRSASESWCGPLVARGATATVGNVFEPYLEYLHRPDLLLEALARGDNLVDAAYYALPVLSWQSVVIGDPLYRPFAVSLSEQLRRLSSLPPRLAGYAAIRKMNLLDAAGKNRDAIDLGQAAMREAPSLALALALAPRLQATGNGDAAAWLLNQAADSGPVSSAYWEVLREAAAFLAAHGRPGESIALYRKLFANDSIPPSVLSPWLGEARQVALDSHDAAQAAEWEDQIGRTVEKSVGSVGP